MKNTNPTTVRDTLHALADRIEGANGEPICIDPGTAYELRAVLVQLPETTQEIYVALYRILGELGAGVAAVFDLAMAAGQGEPLPHASLLPSVTEQRDELLAALEILVDNPYREGTEGDERIRKIARAAIAKAKGVVK